MRVTLRDGKLICVSVETWTPKASVVVLEWFRPEMSPEFYLRYVKAAIPTARVDFPSSLPDAEKKRAFDVSTSLSLRITVRELGGSRVRSGFARLGLV